MDPHPTLALAVSLARGAGELARRALGTGEGLELDYSVLAGGVPQIALDAERRIVHRIQATHPDHGVLGRFSGQHGDASAETLWVVDPLDGLDNVRIGLELHGVAITVVSGDGGVAVFHDAVLGRTCAGGSGLGVRLDDQVARPEPDPGVVPDVVTVSCLVEEHDRAVRSVADRVLRTGCTGRDWTLVVASGTQAIVAPATDPMTTGGALLVAEAGGVVEVRGDLVVAGRPDVVARLTPLLP